MEGYGVKNFELRSKERKDLEKAYLEVVGVDESYKSDLELMEGITQYTYMYLKTYQDDIYNKAFYLIMNDRFFDYSDDYVALHIETTLYDELKRLKKTRIKIKEDSYEFGSILDTMNLEDLELTVIEKKLVEKITDTFGG